MFFPMISGYYISQLFSCGVSERLICFCVKFKGLFVALTHPVAMKASPTVITRYSLRLVALFVLCCAILVHLSATNEIRSEQSQREQIVDRVFDDGEKRTLLHRQRKSAKKKCDSQSVGGTKKAESHRRKVSSSFAGFSFQFIRSVILFDWNTSFYATEILCEITAQSYQL